MEKQILQFSNEGTPIPAKGKFAAAIEPALNLRGDGNNFWYGVR